MVLTLAETPAATDLVNRTWAIGGPFSDLVDATSSALPSTGEFDRVYCSNEGGADWYVTSGQTIAAGSGTQASGLTEIEGYGVTEGDNLPLIIQANCSSAVLVISVSQMAFSNITIKEQKSTYIGLQSTASYNVFRNIQVMSPQAGATGAMIYVSGSGNLLVNCGADGGGVAVSSCISLLTGSNNCAIGCVGRNGVLGFNISSSGSIELINCLSCFNSSHGVTIGTSANPMTRCIGLTSHGNGGSGIKNDCVSATLIAVIDSILSSNAIGKVTVTFAIRCNLRPGLAGI